jgi:hypothetical protein
MLETAQRDFSMARKQVKVQVELAEDVMLALLNKFAEDVADGLFFVRQELSAEGLEPQREAVTVLMSRCLKFKEDLLVAHGQATPTPEPDAFSAEETE